MRLLTAILIFGITSCSSSTKIESSFWESQKSSFKHQNRTDFVSDSALRADCKTLNKISHSLFDTIYSKQVYLYSWQVRDSTKNGFSVIKDGGELGLKIYYFILDKKDSLLSWTQVAGKGSEGGYWFETSSKFKPPDTILSMGAITQWYDHQKEQKLERTKGDTTFSYLLIHKNGTVTKKLLKEVKDLHYENE